MKLKSLKLIKILLIFLFISLSGVTLSQSTNQSNKSRVDTIIVLSKAKHDALKQDIEDYKKLIVSYDSLTNLYRSSVNDLVLSKDSIETQKIHIKKLGEEMKQLEIRIDNYKLLDERYAILSRDYKKERDKNFKMRRQIEKVYLWKGLTGFLLLVIILGILGGHH